MTAKIGIKYIKEINTKTLQRKTPYVLHRVPVTYRCNYNGYYNYRSF